MFCKQCGSQIPEGNSFCPQCGANNAPQEPVNQIPIENIQTFDGDDDDDSGATALLIEEPVAPAQPVAPVQPMDVPAQPVAPVQNAFNVPQPMGANQPVFNQAPMPVAQPPKKSKAGLIIGIVAGAIVAIIAIIVIISLIAGGNKNKDANFEINYTTIKIGEEFSTISNDVTFDDFYDYRDDEEYLYLSDMIPAYTIVEGSISIGRCEVELYLENTTSSPIELRDTTIIYACYEDDNYTILNGKITGEEIYDSSSSEAMTLLESNGFKKNYETSDMLDDRFNDYDDIYMSTIFSSMKVGEYANSDNAFAIRVSDDTYYLFSAGYDSIYILNSDGADEAFDFYY